MRVLSMTARSVLGLALAVAIPSAVSFVFTLMPPEIERYANIGAYGVLFAVIAIWAWVTRD